MKVRSIMTGDVVSCRPEDTLEVAARLLWERDCGALPVVDVLGNVRAMITDRDICMAAYITGRPLGQLRVAESMSTTLATCGPDDDLSSAARSMIAHAVRRLPVVDPEGKLCGVLSLNDVTRADGPGDNLGARVLDGVSRPRSAGATVASDPTPEARPAGKPRAKELRPAAPAKPKAKRTTKRSKKAAGKPSRKS